MGRDDSALNHCKSYLIRSLLKAKSKLPIPKPNTPAHHPSLYRADQPFAPNKQSINMPSDYHATVYSVFAPRPLTSGYEAGLRPALGIDINMPSSSLSPRPFSLHKPIQHHQKYRADTNFDRQ